MSVRVRNVIDIILGNNHKIIKLDMLARADEYRLAPTDPDDLFMEKTRKIFELDKKRLELLEENISLIPGAKTLLSHDYDIVHTLDELLATSYSKRDILKERIDTTSAILKKWEKLQDDRS